jgi:hypothetical protein
MYGLDSTFAVSSYFPLSDCRDSSYPKVRSTGRNPMHRLLKRAEVRLWPPWRKPGPRALSLSVALHVVLVIVASLWAWRIPPKETRPRGIDFMPSGGGGGDPAALQRTTARQQVNFTLRQLGRAAAEGVAGETELPDPFESSRLKPLEPAEFGARSGGMGGTGSGGGMGEGRGKGFGAGTGIGSGKGNGSINPFGMIDPDQGGLTGTFYNLNRSPGGQAQNNYYADLQRVVNHFVNHGWNAGELAAYHEAPQKLHAPRIYMPSLRASDAPRAFRQPADYRPCWLAIYRGRVIAPKSGKFRFVGAGDDFLVVRFAGRNVFDFGYGRATTPDDAGIREALAGSEKLGGAYGTCPMEPPLRRYRYPGTEDWNRNLGGMAVGPVFEVTEGRDYPVEILIGEGQGGLFAAGLLIEEVGVVYPKADTAAPILPLFRTDGSRPANFEDRSNAPPFDPDGPVWKVARIRDKI